MRTGIAIASDKAFYLEQKMSMFFFFNLSTETFVVVTYNTCFLLTNEEMFIWKGLFLSTKQY